MDILSYGWVEELLSYIDDRWLWVMNELKRCVCLVSNIDDKWMWVMDISNIYLCLVSYVNDGWLWVMDDEWVE